MILPKHGRIVIVDDDMDDIKDFMEIFSKDGLSFSYFNGNVETLPVHPLSDTFLMFLDLELDGSAIGDDATQASQVISVIEHILGDSAKDHSVVIIVWSKSLTILSELKPRMAIAGIHPLAMFEMDKLSCKTDGHFDLSLIRADLEAKMSKLPAINLLYYWDNISGQATANVYRSILPSSCSPPEDKNRLLNTYFEELAKAYIGKGVTADDSYATINMLNTFLQNEIGKSNCGAMKLDISPENKATISLGHYAAINSRINTSSVALPLSCGSIHVNPFNDIKIVGFDIFADKKAAKDWDKNAYENMTQIICEVSTVCDQAQGRKRFHRFVPGLLVSSVFGNYFKQNADYLYISCLLCHENVFENSPFYMALDFRQFFTVPSFETPPELLFQINENLLMHIQNRLGRQVSNPGVVFANHIKKEN